MNEGFSFYCNSGNEPNFFIPLPSFLKKVEDQSVEGFPRIRILFQWNNGCCFFFKCGYPTKNHAMCYPFVPIIIVFVKNIVELFYHYNTDDGGSIPQVVVDNTRNCAVYNFADHDLLFFLKQLVFEITLFLPMAET